MFAFINGHATVAFKAGRYCVTRGSKRRQLAFYVIFSQMRQTKWGDDTYRLHLANAGMRAREQFRAFLRNW